ncbi:acyl-CoA synthetase, partial [Enterococcus faecium]
GIADRSRPLHVGVLLGNNPDMLTAMAAAGLGGYVLVGVNNTRRGQALGRDIRRGDCQILVTDTEHRALLEGVDLPGVRVLVIGSPEWAELLAQAGELIPHREVAATSSEA